METSGKQIIAKIRDEAINDVAQWFGIDLDEKISPKKASEVERYIKSHMKSKEMNFYYKSREFESLGAIILDFALDWMEAGSKAEKKMFYLLKDADIDFHFQYKIDRYRMDFFIEPDLIIELDGPYHQIPKQEQYDKIRDDRLVELGYQVIRIPLIWLILEPDKIIMSIKELLGHEHS